MPWRAVTGVLEQRMRGQRYLSVLVEDPHEVLARADPPTRAAMLANLALLGTPVNIPLRPLEAPLAELTAELARRTPAALPAALRARLPEGVQPRPAAGEAALAELSARADAAGITLPPAYLELLADQDGFLAGDLRIFAATPSGGAEDRLDGVLEADQEWRADPRAERVASQHVLLAEDAAHRYTAHTPDANFHVLARSDHASLAQVSTFSDLIVAAIEEIRHPLG